MGILVCQWRPAFVLQPGQSPSVDIAPNGFIDVIFYAHQQGAPECFDVDAFRQRHTEGWIDACEYDVYYTFSTDDGRSFSPPRKLNIQPIDGSRFVRTDGFSRPGEYIGMASTNDSAYPIWIDTQGQNGTQAYTTRIER